MSPALERMFMALSNLGGLVFIQCPPVINIRSVLGCLIVFSNLTMKKLSQ